MYKVLTAAVLIAAAAAPVTAQKHNQVPEATPDGEPVDCLQQTQIRETKVRNDQIIDFVTNGGKVYRNTLPYSCPSLGFEKKFLHKSSLNQYCSVDTITVLHSPPMAEGASCGLGKFQPVKLAGK